MSKKDKKNIQRDHTGTHTKNHKPDHTKKAAAALLTAAFLAVYCSMAAGVPLWEIDEIPVRQPQLETVSVRKAEIHTEAEAAEVEEPDQLYAKAAVLMDADSGRILYEKNGEDVLPMASTTKIMTCIVALENGNLDDIVTISPYAADQPKVHLGMRAGQEITLRDLLYSMMLESHNDAAAAIAEHIGGKELNLPPPEKRSRSESLQAVTAFAGLMNQKARDIGCFDTYFITPNGLDAVYCEKGGTEKRHSTTAKDLAAIMKYCIRQSDEREMFLTITRTQTYSFSDVSGGRSYSCTNHNAFLQMMDGALSGKTGFTSAAGYCYVGALERDGKCFTVALLACGWPNHKNWKWSDTKTLMNYGLENFSYHEFSELTVPEKWLEPIPAKNGQTGEIGETAYISVRVEPSEDERQGVLLRKDEQITLSCRIEGELEAPVEEGAEIGQLKYLAGDEILKMDILVTAQDVQEIDFRWCFAQILEKYLRPGFYI